MARKYSVLRYVDLDGGVLVAFRRPPVLSDEAKAVMVRDVTCDLDFGPPDPFIDDLPSHSLVLDTDCPVIFNDPDALMAVARNLARAARWLRVKNRMKPQEEDEE